jgi:beta-phosphoglucomutase-like phosphatase (HAD superfamily)
MSDRPGIPQGIEALVLDLDGVVTDTAKLHTRGGQRMFDDYLAERAERAGVAQELRDAGADLVVGDPGELDAGLIGTAEENS